MFLSKQKNGVYYLYFVIDDKRYKISTKTKMKAEALKFLKSFDPEIRNKIPETESICLAAFTDQYLSYSETQHRPNTTRTAKSTLREFLKYTGNIMLNEISARNTEQFISHKAKECNPFTLRKHYVTLKSIFATAERWKYVSTNPMKGIPKPKLPEQIPLYFTRQDFSILLKAMGNDNDFKELCVFAVLSGLRQSEIAQLSWANIDFENRIIRVRNSDSFITKSGKNRAVPINDYLYKILIFKQSHATSSLIFARNGKPYRHEFISKRLKKYIRQAGLDDRLHFHSLRHTFASWLVQDGASLYEVKTLLGHVDMRTSMIYAHLQPELMHTTVNKLTLNND